MTVPQAVSTAQLLRTVKVTERRELTSPDASLPLKREADRGRLRGRGGGEGVGKKETGMRKALLYLSYSCNSDLL